MCERVNVCVLMRVLVSSVLLFLLLHWTLGWVKEDREVDLSFHALPFSPETPFTHGKQQDRVSRGSQRNLV